MAPIIEHIIGVLSGQNGYLFYSLFLVFCTVGALISCLYARAKNESEIGERMQLGLLLLLLAQLLLLGGSWFVYLGNASGQTLSFLPPLDHTLIIFSLVLIIWIWVFPNPDKLADGIVTIIETILCVLLLISGIVLLIRSGSTMTFNTTLFGVYAFYTAVGLILVGLILLLVRRPAYWFFGVIMLVITLVGFSGQFFIKSVNAEFSWSVHLGVMVGYLMLFTLPLRLVTQKTSGVLTDLAKLSLMVSPQVGAKLVKSITDLLYESSPQHYYQGLTRVLAEIMNADFCVLVAPQKSGEKLLVPVGYNRLQGKNIEGFTTDARTIPLIVAAIKERRSLIPKDEKSELEVRTLASELGFNQTAHLILVPFHPNKSNALMGLVVLSRPSVWVWTEEDASQLSDMVEVLVAKAGQLARATSPQAVQAEMTEKLQRAQAAADQARLEYAQLKAKYDSITIQAQEIAAPSGSIEGYVESDINLRETIRELEARNKELEKSVILGKPLADEVEQLRQELRSALADLARIPTTLSKSDQKMLELQLSAVKRLDEMQPIELVTSISQEFRQPLSSIQGYTELLLGESVGILGAMQRKFLERVKASTERMGIILNELVEVMSIDSGRIDQATASVDLKAVIDESIANLSAQLSEKNIKVKLELADKLPVIRVNRDALAQILENLLQNACLVTPTDNEVTLAAKVEQRENLLSYILISVTDRGGGIDKADLLRVFLRRYKMENPIIKGIGDTGVGLSIVKSLVELYKGRVWVDAQAGVGSTFSVLLPVAGDQPVRINPNLNRLM